MMLSPSEILKKTTALFAATICLYFACKLILMGTGFYPQPKLTDILLFAILIVIFNSSKNLFYFLLLPFIIAHALYAPVGITFGAPSYQYIASVFATDLMESREFLSQLSIKNYLMPVGIIGLTLAFRWITQKYDLKLHKNKMFLASITAFMLLANSPFKFIDEISTSGTQVISELQRLNNMTIESEWGDSQLINSNYDDYVLIVGESARKDYHHAYGYPVKNTPFMSKANGVLIDGMTAGGTNTIASLKLMFTQPNTQTKEGNYSLNFVDLIKSAGIKTYWISNQGYLGEFDTPISAIANKSDEKIFLKSGDSLNSNTSDFELLPKFTQVLERPSTGKRFIVVHLYGSHPITCDRLNDYPKLFDDDKIAKKYFNVNCYISSIKKTDEVIKRIYDALAENKAKTDRTFSMIYFSDHGLAHQITEDNIVIHNSSGKSKRHYDIPLFKISSDDTKRHEYRVFKSGLNFTAGLAYWVGISNAKLAVREDLFSNEPDKDDYGLKAEIDKIDVPEDKAVVIPGTH
ncbi:MULTISPECIES: phosphoethanolamine transferase [Basfia]|uniref:Sulfatase N-terminal domain-containing protein n=2 Tax=Basfia TaxID=697331 RepID=Q65R72_MANSM|nr:phosphoethanolamine transferase [Basfia succiniciproducens]AAU38538.1 unknown [[Mannheimia] succiniciproducens MBEL55E]QIM69146.1 hypothetical protein A4G13_06950 [Basfia succiniciproducens]SCY18217.1 Phosphoethanolamine transferase for glucans (OPG), alkaline phosphatase superfamily [Basfia succiniciproducens]